VSRGWTSFRWLFFPFLNDFNHGDALLYFRNLLFDRSLHSKDATHEWVLLSNSENTGTLLLVLALDEEPLVLERDRAIPKLSCITLPHSVSIIVLVILEIVVDLVLSELIEGIQVLLFYFIKDGIDLIPARNRWLHLLKFFVRVHHSIRIERHLPGYIL
jgi:hypothetical protein